MKIIIFLIVFLGFSSTCQNSKERKIQYCENFRKLNAVDNQAIVSLSDNTQTVSELYHHLIKENCIGNKNTTGNFYLAFDTKKKSFFNLNQNDNIVLLELNGYLCPNSLANFVYEDLTINYTPGNILANNKNVSLKSVAKLVSDHFFEVTAKNIEPPIIKLILQDDMLIEKSAIIIGEILLGYFKFIERQSQLLFNKSLCDLSDKELMILKENIQFNFKIVPELLTAPPPSSKITK